MFHHFLPVLDVCFGLSSDRECFLYDVVFFNKKFFPVLSAEAGRCLDECSTEVMDELRAPG